MDTHYTAKKNIEGKKKKNSQFTANGEIAIFAKELPATIAGENCRKTTDRGIEAIQKAISDVHAFLVGAQRRSRR